MGQFVNSLLFGAVALGAVAVMAQQSSGPALSKADPPGFVRIDLGTPQGLMVSERAVTVREWTECVDARACQASPGQKSPDAPLTMVSWLDAQDYIRWRSSRDGVGYRLPSHTEWVLFAAEQAPAPREKLFDAPELAWAADYDMTARDVPDGSKGPVAEAVGDANRFGLTGLQDVVWEWTESCANAASASQQCRGARIAMGQHEALLFELVRDPGKAGCGGGTPPPFVGFRLVADVT